MAAAYILRAVYIHLLTSNQAQSYNQARIRSPQAPPKRSKPSSPCPITAGSRALRQALSRTGPPEAQIEMNPNVNSYMQKPDHYGGFILYHRLWTFRIKIFHIYVAITLDIAYIRVRVTGTCASLALHKCLLYIGLTTYTRGQLHEVRL